MSEIPNNFFQYPLLGTNEVGDYTIQRRSDGINPTEMLNYMFKKQFGIPNANPYNVYNVDLKNRISAINSSTLDKQYSQSIPYKPPSDKIIDDTFNNVRYGGGSRYISSEKPYMIYYMNIPMIAADSVGQSFYVVDKNASGQVISILTQNAISPYYGNDPNFSPPTYLSELIITNINGDILDFGESYSGNWLLDCDSGILTFYDSIPTVNLDNPPRISFWRYEGLIGNNTVMTVGDF